MRIIRFIDGHGRECLGTDLAAETAELLAGDLFGELQRTGQRVGVERLLAPISPLNIFGIGQNTRDCWAIPACPSIPSPS
jgi:Rv2993c-like, N-terminal